MGVGCIYSGSMLINKLKGKEKHTHVGPLMAGTKRQVTFVRHSQHVDNCLRKTNTVVTDSRETQRILSCQSRKRRLESSKKSDAPVALLFDLLLDLLLDLLFDLLLHPRKSQCKTGLVQRWSPFGPALAPH